MTINDWRFEGIPQLCPGGRRGRAFEPVRQHLSETVINHMMLGTLKCLYVTLCDNHGLTNVEPVCVDLLGKSIFSILCLAVCSYRAMGCKKGN